MPGRPLNYLAGNVTAAVLDDDLEFGGDGTIYYQYDNLHRLTCEYIIAWYSYRRPYDYRYWYDAVGNRTQMDFWNAWWDEEMQQWDGQWETTTYEYSPRNELTTTTWTGWSNVVTRYEYDLRGNLTKKYDAAYPNDYYTSYSWDSQDHLRKVARKTWGLVQTVEYKYDLLGRRVAKRVNGGSWQWFFYDGLKVVAEGTGQNDKIYYTNSPGVIGGIVCRDNNGTKYWYHTDRLGNVMGVTDSNGNVVSLYTMEAFGNVLQSTLGGDFSQTASEVQPYHLTTKEYDPDAELYYFNARWYDPTTGRFISPEALSLRTDYQYCRNNPTGRVDKDGLAVQPPPDVNEWALGLPECSLKNMLSEMRGKGCNPALLAAGIAQSLKNIIRLLLAGMAGYPPPANVEEAKRIVGGVWWPGIWPRFNPDCPYEDLCTVPCTCLHELVHMLNHYLGLPPGTVDEILAQVAGSLCEGTLLGSLPGGAMI